MCIAPLTSLSTLTMVSVSRGDSGKYGGEESEGECNSAIPMFRTLGV